MLSICVSEQVSSIVLVWKLPWNTKDSLQNPLQRQAYPADWKYNLVYTHDVSGTYLLHRAMSTAVGN